MNTRFKRTLLFVALLAAVVFAGLNVMAYIQARSMMRYTSRGSRTRNPEDLSLLQKAKVIVTGVNIPRPESDATPADFGLKYDTLTIPGLGGKTRLGTWYCQGRTDSTVIILFHAYAADKSAMLDEAAALNELGYATLPVDFRGSGGSSESYTTLGYDEAEDVAAAMHYVEETLPHARIVLYGQSMGAAAVLRAIYKRGLKPDAVIIETVFDRLLTTVKHRFWAMGIPPFPSAELLLFWGGRQAGFNAFDHNPVDYVRSVSCPILFLHGTHDERAKVEDARLVFEAARGQKLFKAFPGVGHEGIVARHRIEWCETVGHFLDQSL